MDHLRTYTPKWESAKPLDWSSTTLDKVAPLEAPYPTPSNFFLRRHLKDLVCVSPVPRNIDELKRRILETAASLTAGVLERAWQEMDCRMDVCLLKKEHTSSLSKLPHSFQIKCIPLYFLVLIPKYIFWKYLLLFRRPCISCAELSAFLKCRLALIIK
jgi:hypothetical protein